ncbi:MAG: hypothetical protein ABEJ65_10605 [bacterium]
MEKTYRFRVLLGIIVLGYVLLHSPYLGSPYSFRLIDYENTVPVLHYLHGEPAFVIPSYLSEMLSFHLWSSPVYYLLLAYPLSLLVHPITTFKLLGIIASFALFGVAVYPARDYTDWFRGLLMLLVFVHAQWATNPIYGNRRAFAPALLVGYVTLFKQTNSFLKYTWTALSTGIYPPAGLLIGVQSILKQYVQKKRFTETLIHAIIIFFVIFAVMSPFVLQKITTSSSFVSKRVPSIELSGSNSLEIIKSIVAGKRSSLFRTSYMFYRALILVAISFFLGLLAGSNRPGFRRSYAFLLLSGFTLWGLSWGLHPYLYQPGKYTKILIPIVACFWIAESILPATYNIRKHLVDHPARFVIYVFTVLILGGITFNITGGSERVYWIVAGGLMTYLSVVSFRGINRIGLTLVLLLILPGILLFYPHSQRFTLVRGIHGKHPSYFKELFKFMKTQTDPGMIVAGPEPFSDASPIYSKRRPYFRFTEMTPAKIRKRVDVFRRKFYCTSSPASVRNYLKNRSIDYLFIDENLMRSEYCKTIKSGKNPVLLDFRKGNTPWNKNGFYVVEEDQLMSWSKKQRD